MIIYSNGCSHTKFGDDFFSISYPEIVIKEMCDDDYVVDDLDRGFDNTEKNRILNKKYSSKNILFKHAFYGKSNDLIFYETLNYLYTTLNSDKKPDLLIIQWSGPNRRFHTDVYGTIIDVNLHDNPELGVKFEPIASEQTLQYMIALQDICKLHKIKYIFIPYMELDESVVLKSPLYEKINLNNYTIDIVEGHRNYFRKNFLVVDIQGHPNFYGIYEISKLILKKLDYQISDISKYITESDIRDSVFVDKNDKNFIQKFAYRLGDGVIDSVKNLKDLI